MNVNYLSLNPTDVAKMLGLDRTTVQSWCRKGIINYIDRSEPDSKKARYEISEEEAEYLRTLFKKHGKRKGLLHYDKNYIAKHQKEKKIDPVTSLPEVVDYETAIEIEEKRKAEEVAREEKRVPVKRPSNKIDEDKMLNNIIYIREIKERIEDCKAELAQLENEYAELKQEIIEQL